MKNPIKSIFNFIVGSIITLFIGCAILAVLVIGYIFIGVVLPVICIFGTAYFIYQAIKHDNRDTDRND